MTHRTYAARPINCPDTDFWESKCKRFCMDYSVIEDFYNVLIGKGRFDADQDHRKKVGDLLSRSNSYKYAADPVAAVNQQLAYDKAVQAFVVDCVKRNFITSATIESDIIKMNEGFSARFKDYDLDESENMKHTVDGTNRYSIPDFSTVVGNGVSSATNFLSMVCKSDHIDDIRLFSPSIQKELQVMQDIACNVKAALAYNKGTSRKDTNTKTDFAQQRSNKSLQEAKFLARSEYAYDTNTRLARLVANQSQVLVPQKKARKKFARFLLLDCSGSMTYYSRYNVAAAILLDSIESVVANGDTLHLAMFGDDFFYKGVVTKDNAHDILLEVCNRRNYIKGTDYGAVVQTAWDILQKSPDRQQLEIILLSDGKIENFKPLTAQQEGVVHFVDLSNGDSIDSSIARMVREHEGTVTVLNSRRLVP